MRCFAVAVVISLVTCAALGDEPDVTDKIVQKLLKDAYPPPLNGRIKLTIDEMSPVVLLRNKKTKKIGGGEVRFYVNVSNLDDKDFDYSPGNIDVRILDDKGVEFPLTHIHWNETAHGDSGTYPIPKGKQKGKSITLSFVDDKIGETSKYLIVARYIVLYPKPVPRYDALTAAKSIDAAGAKEKAPAPEGKSK